MGNSSPDDQPVEKSECWCSVNMWRCTDYKTGCTVLDSLKFANQGLRETSQERVATVDASKYKRSKKCFDGIISEVVANIATTSDSWKSCYTNEMDVFFHRVLSCVLELDNMTIYEVSK